MRHSPGLVATYIAVQLILPLLGLWIRWSTQVTGIPFSWQMYTAFQ